MKKNPDISIIVPIYNAEKYLDKCLNSIINQTKKEIEIILINDGSTDNSEKIIKKYNDSRIKYYKNKNQGIGKTRNFGIDKSTGKYIIFVDSDDYIEYNACEKLFNKIETENLDIVICNFYKQYSDEHIEKVTLKSFENTTLKQTPSLINEVNLAPWNKIYKSEFIKTNNIRFNEKLKYEDVQFVIESIDKAKNIGMIDDYLNYYVIHNSSETTVRDEKCFDIIKVVDIVRKYFKNNAYIKDELDLLTISILINYNIQQRVQVNKKVGMKFIDESFNYLKKEIPNYKKNIYFKKRNKIKAIIEKNKLITKIYCLLYKKENKSI